MIEQSDESIPVKKGKGFYLPWAVKKCFIEKVASEQIAARDKSDGYLIYQGHYQQRKE